jgi:hypothetical protein
VLSPNLSLTTAQLEDSGSLVVIGASAGSRKDGEFGPVSNHFDKSACTMDVDVQHISVAACASRLIQVRHPPQVHESIEGFYQEQGLPHLTPEFPYPASEMGSIEIPHAQGSVIITGVKYSPGSAIFTHQYSRYAIPSLPWLALTSARHVHTDLQPHTWSAFWTTLREGLNPGGGHFYVANYGIRVESAQDTSVAWRPTMFHTTSLGSWLVENVFADLDDPSMTQQGIAFVSSSRIATMYKKWSAKLGISDEQRVRGLVADLILEVQAFRRQS